MSNSVLMEGREFSVSNLDKVFWPEEGYSKKDLLTYYVEVAPYILPYLNNRPMVFTRYPNGIMGKSFYQKNAPEYLPGWIQTFPWYSSESHRYINFILVKETATLAWLANQACIEMHPWLSRIDSIDFPDFVVLDLDPSPGSTYNNVIDIALVLKQLLDSLKLRSYSKTSGAQGLHIYIPIINKYSYQQIRTFAGVIAQMVAQVLPAIATVERTVRLRGNKVYVDYLQNVQGKTLASVYSVRPRKGATVSAPIHWDEIKQVLPQDFTISTVISRIEKMGDLFAPVLEDKQDLDNAFRQLGLS